MKQMSSHYRLRGWSYLLVAVTILLLWQSIGEHNRIVRMLLSTPGLAFEYGIENGSALLGAFGVTALESILGLAVGLGVSFITMLTCLYIPRLFSWVMPVMIASQVVPLITLAPLFIILFGVGVAAKVAMAALLCFFPIFVNFARGIRAIDSSIHEFLYLYNSTTRFKVFRIFLPLSMPYLMTGLRISATLAVIGAIVGEFNGAEIGIGKNLFLAAKRLEPELMICSLALSAVLGAALYGSVYALERRLAPWYSNGPIDLGF